MTGDIDEPEEINNDDGAAADAVADDNDSVADALADGDIVVDIDDDNVGDLSVEINVEELVAKIESTEGEEVAEKVEVRKKLDDILEQHDGDLDSTYEFDLNSEDD
jgi:hypothetical protein